MIGYATPTALLERVLALQRAYIDRGDPGEVFEELLDTFIEATGSEFGFIGEVIDEGAGARFLRTHAFTNLAWTDEMRERYAEKARTGLEFHDLDSLLGAALISGQVVVSNRPDDDERAGGVPEGHPLMRAFLGLPLTSASGMIGLVGLANRPGGFEAELVEQLEPLITTTGVLLESRRHDRVEAEVRAQLERAAAILDNTPDFVGWCNESGSIRHVNEGGRRLIGLGRDEALTGDPVGGYAPAWAAERIRTEAVPIAVAEGVWSGESAYLDAQGEEVPVSQVVIAHCDESGGLRYLSTIARDISERHELEQLKDDFISTISHELRTPLASIVGYTELLGEGSAGPLSPDQHRVVETITRNADRLLGLIDDLLSVGALRSNRPAPRGPVDLGRLVEHQVEAMAPLARRRGLELSASSEGAPAVWGSSDELERVLANLVSNAIKFTPGGGRVDIVARRRADDPALAELSVSDTGIGIPPGDRELLFTRFSRASNVRNTAMRGSGLGLAIVDELVTAHGGRIEVDSELDAGTTMTVLLPRADAATTVSEKEGSP